MISLIISELSSATKVKLASAEQPQIYQCISELVELAESSKCFGKLFIYKTGSFNTATHVSNVQNPVDIPLYWLVDRDPYNGLL